MVSAFEIIIVVWGTCFIVGYLDSVGKLATACVSCAAMYMQVFKQMRHARFIYLMPLFRSSSSASLAQVTTRRLNVSSWSIS